jgi:hypothetical protein
MNFLMETVLHIEERIQAHEDLRDPTDLCPIYACRGMLVIFILLHTRDRLNYTILFCEKLNH